MSAFGAAPGSHDVGARLSWTLTPAQAEKRVDWETRRLNMQTVCLECHSSTFTKTLYENADKVILQSNANVKVAQDIIFCDLGIWGVLAYLEPLSEEEQSVQRA